jgi:hypothetical protein
MIWPLVVVLSVGCVLAVVLVVGERLFPGTLLARRAFRCPFRGRVASAEFVESVWDGRRVDVSRCSLFVPPTAVDCHKRCLDLEDLDADRIVGAARTGAAGRAVVDGR